MTDTWDFYFFEHAGTVGSIFVDLGLEADAPLAGFTRVGRLSVDMRQPRADGLSSNEEYPQLVALEDALKTQLDGGHARYVGRNTAQGCRDFYFYLDADADADWQARVAGLMALFPGYAHRCESWDDPTWDAYFTFLLPDVAQHHTITNRQVCEALKSHGDLLEDAREIDHWAYFQDAAARDAFIAKAATLGFQLRHAWDPDEDSQHHVAQVYRLDVPALDHIDAVTHPLLEAALALGGDYDGWECVVVKSGEIA
jgi:hypothetical protein